jgi:hypothetical protein
MDDHVAKPIEASRLFSALENALRQAQPAEVATDRAPVRPKAAVGLP